MFPNSMRKPWILDAILVLLILILKSGSLDDNDRRFVQTFNIEINWVCMDTLLTIKRWN